MDHSLSCHNIVNLIEKDNVIMASDDENDSQPVFRIFEISLNGFTVELCSLGASITRINLRSSESDDTNYDDVVLGYDAVEDMHQTENPFYFGVCTGRVTNRIRRGRFQTETNGKVYEVAINNEPNHLHGGLHGFSKKNWQVDSSQQDDPNTSSVRFFYISEDMDQGYPGKVRVAATYTLKPTPCHQNVKLCIELTAELLDDTPSPINMTQHTYFNLGGHDNEMGILDHNLRLYSHAYTPVDESGIPTRDIQPVTQGCAMDWQCKRTIRQALTQYIAEKLGRTSEQIHLDMEQRDMPLLANIQPYGFDHNYVVSTSTKDDDCLLLVAVLQCTNRRLTVRSTQPGVQLYTANHLDGSVRSKKRTPTEETSASNCQYYRWQGLCLETQHFPDSILVDENIHPEFATGQCPILTSSSRSYHHLIEYTFENNIRISDSVATVEFKGKDSDENYYNSVEEMWKEQGVTDTSSSSWYERAATYYEENCTTTIDGVLGGFSSITELDIQGSIEFIHDLELIRPEIIQWTKGTNNNNSPSIRNNMQRRRACECGAGLGRVTYGILLKKLGGIEQCDLIESSAALLNAASDYLGNTVADKCRFFCTSLQDWQPTRKTYSVIWIQWVLSYLTDDDVVSFFRRCGESLVDDGLIVLKENTCSGGMDFEVDNEDASVTRSLRYWKHLIHKAGLRIIYEKIQDGFPDEIYPVPMLALDVCPTSNL